MTTLADKLQMIYEQKGLISKPEINRHNGNYYDLNELLEYFDILDESPVVWNGKEATFKQGLDYMIDKFKFGPLDAPTRHSINTTLEKLGYHKSFIDNIKNFLGNIEYKIIHHFNPNDNVVLYDHLKSILRTGEAISAIALLFLIFLGARKIYRAIFKKSIEDCEKLSGAKKEECLKRAKTTAIKSQIKQLETTKKLANKTDEPAKFKKGIDEKIKKLKKEL